MLPKINRLSKSRDVSRVYNRGKYFRGSYLSFKIYRGGQAINRFAFIVSNKVAKKAVVRNKIKRRLRSIIQHRMKSIKTGYDIIILALPSAVNADFSQLEQDVARIIERQKIFI